MYFAVRLSSTTNVDSGNIIPFNTLERNVGTGFNVTTHKFTAPLNATYEFTLQIMTGHADYGKAELTVNGQADCKAHTGLGTLRFIRLKSLSEYKYELFSITIFVHTK